MGDGGCNISLGTSGTIFITNSKFSVDPHNALHSFPHADGGYHLMGCILSAASCNKWWMEDILKTEDYQKEQTPITVERLGRNDVYYLPYLMGERSPHNDPAARGAFIGMRMNTSEEPAVAQDPQQRARHHAGASHDRAGPRLRRRNAGSCRMR